MTLGVFVCDFWASFYAVPYVQFFVPHFPAALPLRSLTFVFPATRSQPFWLLDSCRRTWKWPPKKKYMV